MTGISNQLQWILWGILLKYCVAQIEDCFPFLNLPMEVPVPENIDGGSEVFKLSLADPFKTQYTVIFYPDFAAQIFDLDFLEHKVYVRPGVRLDHESQAVYQIHFLETAISKQCNLTLNITDVNEPPVFSKDVYHFFVKEGPADTKLWKIDATDPDKNDNLFFELSSIEGQKPAFKIDSETQMLSYASDYDVDDITTPDVAGLYVTVSDDEGLFDSAFVIVTVLSINDNAPRFVPSSASLYLSEGTPAQTAVSTLHAIDADGDSIRFGLGNVSSEIMNYFRVTSKGEIMLIRKLNTDKTMELLVTADDGGQEKGTATVTVIISQCEKTNSTTELNDTEDAENTDKEKTTQISTLSWLIPVCIFALTVGVIMIFLFIWNRKRIYRVKDMPDK